MKNKKSPETLLVMLSYPSFMLGFGALLFTLQISFRWWTPGGLSASMLTGLAAATLAGGMTLAIVLLSEFCAATRAEAKGLHAGWSGGGLLLVLLAFLAIALFSALKPAHLIQEGDFVNYHLMIPKQHWLAGSWQPLEWSYFEYRTMLVQYALSFLWVGLPLVNKLPQFLMLVFLLLKLWSFFYFLGVARPFFAGLASAVALLAFRGVAIQAGMAMLDLPNIYFLASLAVTIVFLQKHRASALVSLIFGIDAAAYLGHKSFGVVFFLLLLLGSEVLLRVLFRRSILNGMRGIRWRIALPPLLVLWGANLARSFYFTGDPFYPVLLSLTQRFCNSSHLHSSKCEDVIQMARDVRSIAIAYGYGYDVKSLFKTFFILPLAIDGPSTVNNIFDYPLGLAWYLVWAILAWVTLVSKRLRPLALYSGTISLVFYVLWFMGSQQSRWLYPVLTLLSLTLGYFSGILREKAQSKARPRLALILSLIVAAGFVGINGARVLRSQRWSFRCFGVECLKTREHYFEDFQRKCSETPLVLADAVEHGYISCLFKPK